FRIHSEPRTLPIGIDRTIWRRLLASSRSHSDGRDDDGIVDPVDSSIGREDAPNLEAIERVRGQLLSMEPKKFEFFVKDLLIHCGFIDVCVTKFSSDGGVDVTARTGDRIWIFENSLVQIQAKRWLHSVGRKEVAELRGSLQPFAKGAVVTPSHFSRAAIN